MKSTVIGDPSAKALILLVEAGCDGFIARPCLPPDLVHEISRYLRAQGADRRGGQRRH